MNKYFNIILFMVMYCGSLKAATTLNPFDAAQSARGASNYQYAGETVNLSGTIDNVRQALAGILARKYDASLAEKAAVDKQLAAETARIQQLAQQIAFLRADKNALDQQLASLTADKITVDQQLAAAIARTQQLTQELTAAGQAKTAVDGQLATANQQLQAETARLGIAIQERDQSRQDKAVVDQLLAEETGKLRAAIQERDQSRQETNDSRAQLREAKLEIQSAGKIGADIWADPDIKARLTTDGITSPQGITLQALRNAVLHVAAHGAQPLQPVEILRRFVKEPANGMINDPVFWRVLDAKKAPVKNAAEAGSAIDALLHQDLIVACKEFHEQKIIEQFEAASRPRTDLEMMRTWVAQVCNINAPEFWRSLANATGKPVASKADAEIVIAQENLQNLQSAAVTYQEAVALKASLEKINPRDDTTLMQEHVSRTFIGNTEFETILSPAAQATADLRTMQDAIKSFRERQMLDRIIQSIPAPDELKVFRDYIAGDPDYAASLKFRLALPGNPLKSRVRSVIEDAKTSIQDLKKAIAAFNQEQVVQRLKREAMPAPLAAMKATLSGAQEILDNAVFRAQLQDPNTGTAPIDTARTVATVQAANDVAILQRALGAYHDSERLRRAAAIRSAGFESYVGFRAGTAEQTLRSLDELKLRLLQILPPTSQLPSGAEARKLLDELTFKSGVQAQASSPKAFLYTAQ